MMNRNLGRLIVVLASTTFLCTPSAKLCMASDQTHYQWVQVTSNAAWAPRDGAGALVYDNKMWLLGGWNPPDRVNFPLKCNNEVWNSTNGADWTLVKPNTFKPTGYDPNTDWEGRHTAGYAVHQNKMWVVGGDPLQGHYQSDVWNSSDGVSWTHINKNNPVPWGPRALHHTTVFDGKIWVMGGQTMPDFAPADEHFYNDIWNSTDGINWTQVATEGPMWSPRGQIGNNVVFNGRMWILGGGTYDTPQTPTRNYYNDVWSSADGVRWEKHLDNAPWQPRQYHEVAVFDGKMWVMEGYNGNTGGNRKDVWYSDDGINWHEVPNTPWNPRHAATVYTYDNALWMVAGNNMERDVWKLIPSDQPGPVLQNNVDFEEQGYVAGNQCIGIYGWNDLYGASNVITPDSSGSGDLRVIDGTQSLRLGGDNNSIMYRKFISGTVFGDSSSISTLINVDGPDGSQAEFHFSNATSTHSTPAGIIGIVGENFHLYGLGGDSTTGIDTGVPFLSNVDYRLEVVFDLTNQSFTCYATNVTTSGPRNSLGTAQFNQKSGSTVGPEDFNDSGLYLITRNGAVAIIDNLFITPCAPGDANRNGVIDAEDAAILAANWQTSSGASWDDGDFNSDGRVNGTDATLMAVNWPSGHPASASVPEGSMAAPMFVLIFVVLNQVTRNIPSNHTQKVQCNAK